MAVLASATSVFNVLYQIRANRDLQTRKGEILEKIEEVRASAAQRLDVQRGSILEIIETKKANSVFFFFFFFFFFLGVKKKKKKIKKK